MKLILTLCFIFSLSYPVLADFRLWEDVQGKQYKAEFVQELFGKITLRDEKGMEFRLAVEELSELDQKYLRVKVAPEMEIDFSKTSSLKPKPKETMDLDNDTIMIYEAKVTLKKISKRPYTSRLYVTLYLIAEDVTGGGYLLLNKTDYDFVFTDKANPAFTSDPVTTRVFDQNSVTSERRGERYAGYLVVVRDFEDNIVAVKTDLPDWITKPDVISSLRNLYMHGSGSLRSRYFDKTGCKAPVPRPQYYVQRHGKEKLP